MLYLIKLKYGVCLKWLCAICNGCIKVNNDNTAIVNSTKVLCLKYNFAEMVFTEKIKNS